jgi:hypothetical protein
MSWLDSLFNAGYRTLENNGTPLPEQRTMDVQGATLTDVPGSRKTLFVVDPPTPVRMPFGPPGKLITPPDISAFTLVNPSPNFITAGSTAVIENHPSGYGFVIYGTGTSAHSCFNGAFVTRGTNTTLIVQVDTPYWENQPDGTSGSLAPPYGGIFLYSPATDKAVMFGPYAGATPSPGTDSSINLFNFNIAGSGGATTEVARLLPAHPTLPVWLKWHDDGVNYNFSYSFDGEFTYAPTISVGRTAFLSDAGTQIGIAAGAQQVSGTRAGNHAFSMWCGSWSIG